MWCKPGTPGLHLRLKVERNPGSRGAQAPGLSEVPRGGTGTGRKVRGGGKVGEVGGRVDRGTSLPNPIKGRTNRDHPPDGVEALRLHLRHHPQPLIMLFMPHLQVLLRRLPNLSRSRRQRRSTELRALGQGIRPVVAPFFDSVTVARLVTGTVTTTTETVFSTRSC